MSLPESTTERCVAFGLGNSGLGGAGALTAGGGAAGLGRKSEQPLRAARPMPTAKIKVFIRSIYSKVGRSGNWLCDSA
jgi:hypothetical protein